MKRKISMAIAAFVLSLGAYSIALAHTKHFTGFCTAYYQTTYGGTWQTLFSETYAPHLRTSPAGYYPIKINTGNGAYILFATKSRLHPYYAY